MLRLLLFGFSLYRSSLLLQQTCSLFLPLCLREMAFKIVPSHYYFANRYKDSSARLNIYDPEVSWVGIL